MTDHGGAASPRTEAGKRLLKFFPLADRDAEWQAAQLGMARNAILAIEAEAAQEAPAPDGLREQDRTRIREAFGQIVRSDYDAPFQDEAIGVLDAAFAAVPWAEARPPEGLGR